MPAEKQNNTLAGKLDGLATLPPGFNFHKEDVWYKLQPELRSKKKNFLPYYAAASALILIIVTAMLSNTKQTISRPVAIKPITRTTQLKTQSISIATKEKSITAKKQNPGKTKQQPKQLNKIASAFESLVQPVTSPGSVPVIENPAETIRPVIQDMAVKVKHKFPVMHVNELNQPRIEEEPLTEKTASVYPFKKQLLHRVDNSTSTDLANEPLVQRNHKLFSLINLQ
jgi:hypothetical protein